MKINQTRDYAKFQIDHSNRAIRPNSNLLESMRKHGWLEAYPMHVVCPGNGAKLLIRDGQHRFQCAKELQIPVLYVCCQDEQIDIAAINSAQMPWNMADFLSSRISQGDKDYILLRDFCDSTGIAISQAAALLYAGAATVTVTKVFKSGNFKVKTAHHADTVGDLVKFLNAVLKFRVDARFVSAISHAVRIKGFSVPQFRDRAKQYSHKIEKRADVAGYIDIIETVYNYKSRETLPISHIIAENTRAAMRAAKAK